MNLYYMPSTESQISTGPIDRAAIPTDSIARVSLTSSYLSMMWMICFMLFSSKMFYLHLLSFRCHQPLRKAFFFDAPADPISIFLGRFSSGSSTLAYTTSIPSSRSAPSITTNSERRKLFSNLRDEMPL